MAKRMKSAFAGLVVALGAASAATGVMADGMPAGKMAAPAPAMSSAFNWSGFFVGANAGGAWSSIDHTVTFTNGNTEVFKFDPSSFAGGAQVIYQGQWGHFVVGVEAGVTGFNLAERKTATVVANRSRQSDIDWMFTLTPRIGYAKDNWMAYIKGGYAGAEVYRGTTVTSTDFQLTGTNRREDGWTIGAGFEVALSSWVTLGLDYSYVNIEPHARLGSPQFVPAGITPGSSTLSDAEIHLVTARINFKLGH